MKKTHAKPAKKILKKTAVRKAVAPSLTKEEFFGEMEKISLLLRALKNEMNERFEKHENIILAEYRHRIEDLEGKVRRLMEK
ncbi:MAG: hypothetical protein WCT49_02560 [Candidatus Paceibacterota bacterium]|jgi:hypothetical protein|nr:hypothetical protein [Candidatus Paceibacterota bacterium]